MGNRSTRCGLGGVGLYLSNRLPFLWPVYRQNVLAVDPTRMTPAVRHNDGRTMCRRTKKCCSVTILRPLPSRSVGWAGTGGANGLPARDDWLLAGVVLAGAVQDFMVLFVLRAVTVARWVSWSKKRWDQRRGDSAGGLLYDHGHYPCRAAMIVVKALTHSPWGTYTVASPFRWRCLWGSTCAICVRGVWRSVGNWSGVPDFRHYLWRLVAESPTWAPYFDFTGVQLT